MALAADQVAYIDKLIEQQDKANAANEQRYSQLLGLYDRIASTYQPGGVLEQAFTSQLERTKSRDVGKATQSLVSSGLANTTRATNLPMSWEEEVGQQSRLNLQALMADKLAGSLAGKAGVIERREDIGPDYGLIASLVMQGSSAPSGGGYVPSGGSGGTSGLSGFSGLGGGGGGSSGGLSSGGGTLGRGPNNAAALNYEPQRFDYAGLREHQQSLLEKADERYERNKQERTQAEGSSKTDTMAEESALQKLREVAQHNAGRISMDSIFNEIRRTGKSYSEMLESLKSRGFG